MKQSVLYFDGNCPVCSKEMKLLNKLKNADLELTDLWQANVEIPQDELLRVLHLRTSNGNWLTGLDATVYAWRHTRLGFIFMPLRWPVLRQISDNIYSRWANKRFCKIKAADEST